VPSRERAITEDGREAPKAWKCHHPVLGGTEAELDVEVATAALATTIENLQPCYNGEWLDRFGQPSVYAL